MVMANIMVGDWNDSEETLKEVFQFVKAQSDFLVLTLTTPLPGTKYFEEAERLGRIRERDLGKYDFMHPVVDTKFLSAEEVHHLQRVYLKKYYTQPTDPSRCFLQSESLQTNGLPPHPPICLGKCNEKALEAAEPR